MSYPQTLASKRTNSSNANELTTPLTRIYQGELIDFIYHEVIKAAKKRSKNDSPRFDLDSKEILIIAQKKADESLRNGVLH